MRAVQGRSRLPAQGSTTLTTVILIAILLVILWGLRRRKLAPSRKKFTSRPSHTLFSSPDVGLDLPNGRCCAFANVPRIDASIAAVALTCSTVSLVDLHYEDTFVWEPLCAFEQMTGVNV